MYSYGWSDLQELGETHVYFVDTWYGSFTYNEIQVDPSICVTRSYYPCPPIYLSPETSGDCVVDFNNSEEVQRIFNPYPNPSNGIVFFNEIVGDYTLMMFDISGRRINVSFNKENPIKFPLINHSKNYDKSILSGNYTINKKTIVYT